jgi:multicomponent Na+:H+ antiporter subunit E
MLGGEAMKHRVVRMVGFLAFWVILTRLDTLDVLVGIPAAVIAVWASLRLLPPGEGRLHPLALVRLVLRFLHHSLVAGIDVALRALDPRMPLRPGFIVYRSRLPPGSARNTFCTITSLMPGTLPCGSDASGGLAVHCLDAEQPVPAQLADEEALLLQVLGGPHRHV